MKMNTGAVVAALSATLVTTGFVAGLPTASAVRTDPPVLQASTYGDHERFLSRPAHGAAAVDRLGEKLDQVAALNDMTARALKRLLLADDTVWIHPAGLIYYVDRSHRDIEPEAPEAAPFPYEQTFQLQSKPGSSKTIYLDFNGEDVGGTAWNDPQYYGLAAGSHPAFDMDGSPSTFSNSERDVIQSVWQRVSEDYAPFDVNVTTADPGIDALRRDNDFDFVFGTRALISPSVAAATAICNNACGGSAFMGVFTRVGTFAQPAWVFPHNLGPNDAKAIADATSHEVGHNLNLAHDGYTVGSDSYYEGHGAWAPIMGSSYGRPISQWSQGEYSSANNPQDDLAVIINNGLPLRPDDHGADTAGATPLPSTGGTTEGLIANRTDKDYFALPQSCAGTVSVTAVPAPTSPNLDILLRLVRADGTEVASNNPGSAFSSQDVATGMDAAVTTVASADTPLFAEIDGIGAGNAATNGYSDYASIGQYTLSSTSCSGGGTDPAIVSFNKATQAVGEGAGQAVVTLTRTGSTTTPATVQLERSGGTATPGSDFGAIPANVSFAADQTTKKIKIAITNDVVDEPNETIEVTLTGPGSGTAVGGVRTATLTITDNDEPTGVQPDLLISNKQARGYIGDDIYNSNGSGQTKQRSATRGQLRSFFVELTNDGASKEPFTVTATRPKGAQVTYWVGKDNVTALITGAGGGVVDLAPNEYLPLRVDIKPGKRAKVGSLKSALVTARSTTGLTDVVKAVVKVVRR